MAPILNAEDVADLYENFALCGVKSKVVIKSGPTTNTVTCKDIETCRLVWNILDVMCYKAVTHEATKEVIFN